MAGARACDAGLGVGGGAAAASVLSPASELSFGVGGFSAATGDGGGGATGGAGGGPPAATGADAVGAAAGAAALGCAAGAGAGDAEGDAAGADDEDEDDAAGAGWLESDDLLLLPLCEDEEDEAAGAAAEGADGEATDDIEAALEPAAGLAIAISASVAFCVTTCWKLPPVLAADSKRLATLEAAAVPPVPITLLIKAIVDALSLLTALVN